MSDTGLKQRLAAILAADVAGYSRLMADNERATVEALDAARAIFRDGIAAYRGRVIDMAGDSVLAVFETAAGAVSTALSVQAGLKAMASCVEENRCMRFRIGVHLGDVIEKSDGTVYGDGVNIAARLESLAEPGGITISDAVHGAVRGKVPARFSDRGEQTVKNIPHPVRTFSVEPDGEAPLGAPVASAAGSGAPAPTPAPVADAAAPVARPTDKPSIIVLPFTNMSGSPEQDYFADGLTEDTLTDLSRFRELFVISRNTSFKYKGQAVDVKQVGRDLGVRYVVEGSVRKAGNRVRITVQLIEAESDHHIWAERYDRDLEDIFAIQDEVTSAIVAVLPGRLQEDALTRAARKPPANLAAWECVLEAKVLHHRSDREDNARALALAERAIEMDPRYGHAHAWRACILGQQWGYGWCRDRDATGAEIARTLDVALALDPNDSDVHRILAAVGVINNDLEKAVSHQQKALSLNPNDDLIVVQQGEVLTWIGRAEEGIEWIRKAMKLNPFHPERFWFHLARAQFAARRYAEAVESLRRVAKPDTLQVALMAGCLAQMGDAPAAGSLAAEVLKRIPDFSLRAHCLPMLHYSRDADRDHHMDSLRMAGLPE